MGRVSKEIDAREVKKAYLEVGNIKKLASMFHVSNDRIISILDSINVRKKSVGNKISMSEKDIESLRCDYEKRHLTLSEIAEKHNLKVSCVRKVLLDNGVKLSRWNGHKKHKNTSRLVIITKFSKILDDLGVEHEINFKVDKDLVVNMIVGNTCICFYRIKSLIDDDMYAKRMFLNKRLEICSKNGYRLIQVFEDEYKENPDLIISKLLHILKLNKTSKKIQGRKCEIRDIYSYEAKNFLNENHIQGFVGSTAYLGAFNNGELVGVMSFLNDGTGRWNLTRFATLDGCVCQGVGGKLFKAFIRKYNPFEVYSFADRRWTLNNKDNVYTKLGFELEHVTPPGYTYASSSSYVRHRRERFKKENIMKKYNNIELSEDMTETEMAKKLGFFRIWDCGLFKYVWRSEN